MDKFFDGINNFISKHIKNEKITNICRKVLNREVFMYLVFGVLTTVVSWASYALFDRIVGKFVENNDILQASIANVLSWIAAVLFAFVTNKLWVFDSKSWKGDIVIKELGSFIAARLATGCIEWFGVPLLMKLGMDQELFGTKGMLAKIIASVLVVILNYFFSKLLIFKKKES